MTSGKILIFTAVSVVVAGVIHAPAMAVPVVPNFSQGSMTSHTETTSKVTETINSIDYNTGWQYSVTGTNVGNGSNALNPRSVESSVTLNPLGGIEGQISSTQSSADLGTAQFTITNPGEAFQFTQSYSGPGMTNQTIIMRETVIKSLQSTTSVFSN